MKARLETLLRRLRAPGIVAMGVLVACAGFYFNGVVPAEREVRIQLAAQRAAVAAPGQTAGARGSEAELKNFYGLFPSPAQLTDDVEAVHQLARRAGLDLANAEYLLERPAGRLWAYRITLPVRGTYPQLRQFLSTVLRDMPTASVDALRFERRKAADSLLEAQVRVTLHVRPPGDLP